MLIECVPNISEGRRTAVIAGMADIVRSIPGADLIDVSSDAAHNRSVFTMAGSASALRNAVLALFERAVSDIDLRSHHGVHPRIGAIDVVPFVPLEAARMADCVALAKSVGEEVAGRFGVPVYLYEAAASTPLRAHLEDIRRGGFEGLAAKMERAEWAPDFGPHRPHPSAGASVIGARGFLIAYNINLATNRIEVARTIAASVRSSGGGLPCVKAMGVTLADRGIVQVSMNLTDYAQTPLARVYERVKQEAARAGVAILESEIVGLVPEAALTEEIASQVQLVGRAADKILERRLNAG